MKKLIWAGLLALPLLAVPTPARAWFCFCGPYKVETGANVYFRVNAGPPCAQAGPWYLYWPLEAHFGPPAPTGFPYWPQPMSLPGQEPSHAPPPAPLPLPAPQSTPLKPASFQPVGYYYYPYQTPPTYWYSR